METNKKFTEDVNFIKCCEEAGTKVTIRQASKFKNKKGLAYKASIHLKNKES